MTQKRNLTWTVVPVVVLCAGSQPSDEAVPAYSPTSTRSKQFKTVHCAIVSNDGFVFIYKGVGPVTKAEQGVVWPKGR
jgi:hypothetical protein